MTHACHALYCSEPVPPRLLMCRAHWDLLPPPAQRIVEHHYRQGQETDKRPSPLYVLAANIARTVVALRERKIGERQALDRLRLASMVAAQQRITPEQVKEMVGAMGLEDELLHKHGEARRG